jgi:hypothetical protein
MSKYIIKNCPTLMGNRLCYGKTIKQCVDCTDCILKQIVKKCKKSLEVSYCPIEQEILQLLDIQEVK